MTLQSFALTYEDVWPRALAFTRKWEGGRSNHPRDLGGDTNWGITQPTLNQAREYSPELPATVGELTQEQAGHVLKELFWDPLINDFDDLPLTLLVMFDTSVLFGRNGAIALMQLGLHVAPDSIIGPITGKEMDEYTDSELARLVISERKKYHGRRVVARPDQKVFLQGWLNRAIDLKREVMKTERVMGLCQV